MKKKLGGLLAVFALVFMAAVPSVTSAEDDHDHDHEHAEEEHDHHDHGPLTLSEGHVDLINIHLHGDHFHLVVSAGHGHDDHDHGGHHDDELHAEDVLLLVKSSAQTSVPTGAAYSFLGQAGAPVWVLPQAPNPELLFPGISTEDIGTGVLVGDQVDVKLLNVSGPGGLFVYTTDGLGAPAVRFASDGTASNLWTLPVGSHVHMNWAFTAPGSYTATFAATATLADGTRVSGGPATYRFEVVPAAAQASPESCRDPMGAGQRFDVSAAGAGGSVNASFAYNAASRALSYHVSVLGISPNTVTAATLTQGNTAVHVLCSGGFSVATGTVTLTEAQAAGLASGSLYLQVASVSEPTGFVRVQLSLPAAVETPAPPATVSPPSTGDAGLISQGTATQSAAGLIVVLAVMIGLSAGVARVAARR